MVILLAFPQVLAFIIFICAAVVSFHTTFPNVSNVTDVNAARDLTHGGAGYIIFIVFMTMIWEGVIIALRFLNLPVVNKYIGLVLIAVSFNSNFMVSIEPSSVLNIMRAVILISGVIEGTSMHNDLLFPAAMFFFQ